MPAHFPARLDLATGRNGPVKQRVEPRDTFAAGQRLHVFEKGRETPDDFPAVKILGHFVKCFQRHAGFPGARFPKVRRDFLRRELVFQRDEDAPLQTIQRRDCHLGDVGRHVGFAPRRRAAAPHVTDAEREQSFGRKQYELPGAGLPREKLAMFPQRITLRHFERRPELEVRAGCGRVGRARDDVAGKRVLLEHIVKRRVEFVLRHFPGDQRSLREIRGQQRLPHPTNGPGAQHRLDPFSDNRQIDARLP